MIMYKHLPREYDYAYRGHTNDHLDWGRCDKVIYASRSLAVAKDFARGGYGSVFILAFDGNVEAHRPWWYVEDDPNYYDEVVLPTRLCVWSKLVILGGEFIAEPITNWNPGYLV